MPRSRFVPVKKCSDLLLLRSDCYCVTPHSSTVVLSPGVTSLPEMALDGQAYKFVEVRAYTSQTPLFFVLTFWSAATYIAGQSGFLISESFSARYHGYVIASCARVLWQALDLSLTLATPSLKLCSKLDIRGFVIFSPLTTLKGSVRRAFLIFCTSSCLATFRTTVPSIYLRFSLIAQKLTCLEVVVIKTTLNHCCVELYSHRWCW